ncbi:uncharacterized protein N7479_011477 [Penicillium vulpinum]|uniref:uncharacterized protein n=1 Tax=Penicillium vulpinum TaxID=29845 RepID=UPI0025494385|nr:uncharacterized protein N7479_011477 [Penicillium vulpinum]KAJ5953064.1 hypothetical protein N7479_011477 [Penicillium vulpinum]
MNPSTQPQVSIIFPTGIQIAAEKASASAVVTPDSEWAVKELETKWLKLAKTKDWKALTMYRNQIL